MFPEVIQEAGEAEMGLVGLAVGPGLWPVLVCPVPALTLCGEKGQECHVLAQCL